MALASPMGCSFHIAGDSLHSLSGRHCDPQMPGDVTLVARGDMQKSSLFIIIMLMHVIYITHASGIINMKL